MKTMLRKIMVSSTIYSVLITFLTSSAIAGDSRIFLREASKEKVPTERGAATQYIETSLKDKGHKCSVAILPSDKYKGNYYIMIDRYPFSSTGQFNRDRFTGAAIIAVAILSKNVKWKCSDLWLGYGEIFTFKGKNVGYAIMSIRDCEEARNLYMQTSSVDKFESYWKSRIKYISSDDPEPIL